MQHWEQALRVLLSTEPSSPSERQLRREFHGVCCAGRAAALGTMRHLQLDRYQARGMPFPQQLYVLKAAVGATALTLHADQLGPLMHAVVSQQQHQHQQQEGGTSQPVLPPPSGDGQGSAAPDAPSVDTSLTTAMATISISTTTSSSTTTSRSSRGAPASMYGQQAQLAPAAPSDPHLTHLEVKGELTAAALQQLMVLLDVLPGTQRLQHLTWDGTGHLWRMGAGAALTRGPGRTVWGGEAVAAAIDPCLIADGGAGSWVSNNRRRSSSNGGNSSGSSSSAHVAGAMASGGSGWRSSCYTLAVSNRAREGLSLDMLQPLLLALPGLQVLGLQGCFLDDLAACAPLLRPLRGLVIAGGPVASAADLLATVAGLTNLHHLGIEYGTQEWQECRVPAALGALDHLTSFHLTVSHNADVLLEGLCTAASLKEVCLQKCPGCRRLPEAISALTGLQSLTLRDTGVASLPEGITALTGLHTLVWAHSPYFHPELDLEVVWGLRSLQRLEISGSRSRYAPPDAVTRLTALTALLYNARFAVHVPEALSRLQALHILELKSHWLDRPVPDAVRALPNLRHLQVPPVFKKAAPHV
jgi:hypothetical protein